MSSSNPYSFDFFRYSTSQENARGTSESSSSFEEDERIQIYDGNFSMNESSKEMEEYSEVSEKESSSIDEQKMSEDSKDEKGDNEMKENSGMSATFPSNVYKIQDAFDDDNDYMAYAS